MQNPFSNGDVLSREQTKNLLDSDLARKFMSQVYTTMAIGMAITGMAAWLVANNADLMQFFFTGIMRWIVMFAPLGMVIFLSSRISRMSVQVASLSFAAYSLLTGISLAFIFLIYDLGTIFQVFLITGGTFGAMALIGATTKVDLSKFRGILMFGLVGIIIAMVVNMFMQSSTFDYIVSIIGVLIFAGLTAYDTQKLLQIGANSDPESDNTRKVAIIGALTLYLDFLNLFLFLLRIFGGGRD